jgi:hypothetical protein
MGYLYALVELKTTNALPPEPHGYWNRQVSLQVDAIATTLSIRHDQIYSSVYAIELNDGRTKQYDIFYDEEETLLAKDDAISVQAVLEDWLQWANKEKDTMDMTINDVNRNVGNLCSVCDWAAECLGKGKEIELPEESKPTLDLLVRYSEEAKNVKALKEELKERMLKLGASKAKVSGFNVSLRGGNKKQEIDTSSYSKEEILKIAKDNPALLTVDKSKANKLIDHVDDDVKWIVDGHTTEKTTPLSVIIKKMNRKV